MPSYSVKAGDVIAWKPSSRENEYVKAMAAALPRKTAPAWLNLDAANLQGTVTRIPAAQDLDINVESRLIVEFYSK